MSLQYAVFCTTFVKCLGMKFLMDGWMNHLLEQPSTITSPGERPESDAKTVWEILVDSYNN